MAHFAHIENGKVTKVLVVSNEHEEYGQEYLNSLGLEGIWIQTSYNNNFRYKFAGIGDEYLEDLDIFVPARPVDGNCTWDIKKEEWISV